MACKRILPSQSDLQRLLDYNPGTGIFIWKTRPETSGALKTFNTRYAGTIAGTIGEDGYIMIGFAYKVWGAHRLAWRYMTGEQPPHLLDHIDGDTSNNRFKNLRLATNAENLQNKGAYKNNSSGLRGASWSKAANKWQANITAQGKQRYLGCYDTREQAHAVYLEAKMRLHLFQPTPRAS